MITLDAGVLIAHLDPGDRRHHAASAYLRAFVDDNLVIHSLNLAEVLVAGVRSGRGQEMFDDIEAMGITTAAAPDGEPLRLAALRAATGLKLPDCCALDTALVSGSTLATFDETLAEAARHRHLAVAPRRRG